MKATINTLNPRHKAILRHVLSGSSVVDSRGLYLGSVAEVDTLLAVNEFDWQRPADQKRLKAIFNEAVAYLETQIKWPLQTGLKDLTDLRELFLIASQDSEQKLKACALLKLMHIIHHIDGHEFLYNCPFSRRELSKQVDDKMERQLSHLKRSGFPILSYTGGRKPKESLITKLLCKRQTIASRINDRLRYQIVVPEKKDIVLLLVELFETVLPFNYVMPGTTVNQLIDPELFLSPQELVSHQARDTARSIVSSVSHLFPHSREEVGFSGATYRVVKLVVDMPIRLDEQSAKRPESHCEEFGPIVFSLVEIQMVDEASARENDRGENQHALYKDRQKAGVKKRLTGDIP